MREKLSGVPVRNEQDEIVRKIEKAWDAHPLRNASRENIREPAAADGIYPLPFSGHSEQHDGIAAGVRRKAERVEAVGQLCAADAAGNPTVKGAVTEDADVLREVELSAAQVLDLGDRVQKRFGKLLRADRLEKVVFDAELRGLFHIFEIIVAGQDDAAQIHILRPHLLEKLQPAHLRHLDIRYEDINRQLPQKLQRLRAVGGGASDLHAVFVPVEHIPQTGQDTRLVVHKQYTIHNASFPPHFLPEAVPGSPFRRRGCSEWRHRRLRRRSV